MNPIFYVGCFVGMCIVFVVPFIASIISDFAAMNRRKLSDAEGRFERAARDRDEWKATAKETERRLEAALTLAAQYKAELKALQDHHNSTLPCL